MLTRTGTVSTKLYNQLFLYVGFENFLISKAFGVRKAERKVIDIVRNPCGVAVLDEEVYVSVP